MKVFTVFSICLLFSLFRIQNVGSIPFNLTNPQQSSPPPGRNLSRSRRGCELGLQKSDIEELRKLGPFLFHSPRLIPKSFDARKQWPECASVINQIMNQNTCGSCWAISSTAAMADRLCILTKGAVKAEFSTEELITCAKNEDPEARTGCEGGSGFIAWRYFIDHGIVTGGAYQSQKGCQPYSNTSYTYVDRSNRIEKCRSSCTNPKYGIAYKDDKYYAKDMSVLYSVVGDKMRQVQMEIMINGPVNMYHTLYNDLKAHNSEDVYITREVGEGNGLHAVRVIGWGVEKNVPYWLIANSWGKEWGKMGGFFKMKRGEDHCGIEKACLAGTPRIAHKPKSSSVVLSVSPVLVFTMLVYTF